MNVKHIFFDLDHTLWDFETNSSKTFEYIFQRNQIDVDMVHFHTVYRPINLRYWKLFREDKVTKADLRYSRLREAFDGVGVRIEDEMIHLLSEEYITYLADHNAYLKMQFMCWIISRKGMRCILLQMDLKRFNAASSKIQSYCLFLIKS